MLFPISSQIVNYSWHASLFERPWLSRIADDVPDIATLLLVLIGILLAAVPLSKSLEKYCHWWLGFLFQPEAKAKGESDN
jgi:hypothetical protein